MSKLFGYLMEHRSAVAVIFVLVVIQVSCDLALPQYTSDIVDVGIQQGGISDAAAEYLSGDTVDSLKLFMDDDDISVFNDNYEVSDATGLKADVVYKYTGNRKDRDRLCEALTMPMAGIYMIRQSGDTDFGDMEDALKSGAVSKEDLIGKMRGEMSQYAGDNDRYSESLMNQAAAEFVRSEYESLGVNTSSIQMKYLWKTGFTMILLTLVMVAAAIAISYFASRTGARIGRDTRKKIFTKVMSFGSSEMDRFSTASLITRSTNDIQQVQMTCVILLRMVMMAPVMGIGACIKVAATRTGMGWLAVCAVAAVCILMMTIMTVTMPKFKIMQTLVDRVNLVSREIVSGVPVIRAFSRERFEERRFTEASEKLMKTQLFTQRAMSVMMPAMMIIMNGIAVLIVWFGAKGADLGNLQVGDLIAFITYTMQIVMSFMMLTMAAVFVPRAGVAADRIAEVMNMEASVKEKENPVVIDKPRGTVRFEHVSFRYPGADDDVLSDISFEAEPGKTTAIIGSTGCGKTTLINLIPRFYDVTEGRVTVDGVDVRDMNLSQLRGMTGYVPQKGILFSGDISSNIGFASDDISEEKMRRAAQIAQASSFIEENEEGYRRAIAQGGSNVSGGQKQRLSIARAIASDPEIYIFDDSFSALDYRTDAELRKALAEVTVNSTVIIVAQRIATILHADRIIVLDDGKIAGTGTHSQLLDTCEAYREIAESQLSEEELGRR